jgi:hypothetical protein
MAAWTRDELDTIGAIVPAIVAPEARAATLELVPR